MTKKKNRVLEASELRKRAEEIARKASVPSPEMSAAPVPATPQNQELALQKAERFRIVAEFTYDWEEWRAPNGAILYTSPSCERITGHTVAEFMGDPSLVIKISHPDDQAKVKGHLREDQEQPAIEFDFRIITPAGDIRWISQLSAAVYNEAGEWIGRRMSNRDITERQQMSAAFRKSEERFARLAEQSGTFIWEVDAQGLYTYVNPVVEKVLGYRPDELIGRMHFYDLHPETGREAFKTAAFAVAAQHANFHDLINPMQAKDGHPVWVSTTGIPLMNADGTLRGYSGSDTDVTQRRQTEQHREQQLRFIQTLNDID